MNTFTNNQIESRHTEDIAWLRKNEMWDGAIDADAEWTLIEHISESVGASYTYIDAQNNAMLAIYPSTEPACRALDKRDEDPDMLFDSIFPQWREIGIDTAISNAALIISNPHEPAASGTGHHAKEE